LLRGTINHQTIIYGRDIFPNFKIKYGLSADFADLLSSYRKILPIKFHSPLIKYDLDGKSSNLSRRIRFSVWLGRLIAFRDGNLPFFYKIFAIAFSIIVILIKTINPKAFSNTNRYRSSP
jgi:hypothetical protein